jgi:hypothetical protein
MRMWRNTLAAFLATAVLAGPLYADVVPARKAKARGDAAKVEQRLVSLGVDAATARESAGTLTASELRFFADAPGRIQPMGAQQDLFTGSAVNMWFESVGGVVFLAAGFGTAYYMIHNRE